MKYIYKSKKLAESANDLLHGIDPTLRQGKSKQQ